jgi:hypothetical protein
VSPGFEDRVLAKIRAASVSPRDVERPVEISFEPRWWQGWFPRLALGGAAAALALLATFVIPNGPWKGKEPLAQSDASEETLEKLYPGISPEMLQSMQNLTQDGVLDRMVIQSGSPTGDFRVVAPVDYGTDGPVYVTF